MGFTDNVKEIAKTAKETISAALPLGRDELDIRNVLRRDHELVARLLHSMAERAANKDPAVLDLADELRAELLLHTKSEEQVLYEACKRHGKDLREFAQEGYREHECIEHLLNRMVTEQPGRDGELKATVCVLKEIVDHHVREEEGDLFPKLASEFSDDQLAQMGKRMESLKERIDIEAFPADKVFDDVDAEARKRSRHH